MTRTERKISKLVRAHLDLSGTPYPIRFTDGFDEPQLRGRQYYWTTPSGNTIVRHPGAYGWPTLYHPSTMHIVVGAGWVLEHLLEEERREEMLSGRAPIRFTAEGGIAC